MDSTTCILFSSHQKKFSNGFSEVDGMFKKIGDWLFKCLIGWFIDYACSIFTFFKILNFLFLKGMGDLDF